MATQEDNDVPDRRNTERPPMPYEGVGTHRFETRMSDEEIEKGLGRDARHASEVLHREHSEPRVPVDLVDRPPEEEAKQKAMFAPPSPEEKTEPASTGAPSQ